MTTLNKEQPYMCKYTVSNGPIITVCDEQCPQCKEVEDNKTKQ